MQCVCLFSTTHSQSKSVSIANNCNRGHRLTTCCTTPLSTASSVCFNWPWPNKPLYTKRALRQFLQTTTTGGTAPHYCCTAPLHWQSTQSVSTAPGLSSLCLTRRGLRLFQSVCHYLGLLDMRGTCMRYLSLHTQGRCVHHGGYWQMQRVSTNPHLL